MPPQNTNAAQKSNTRSNANSTKATQKVPANRQRITPFCALATSLYLLPLLVILAGQLLGPENWWLTGFNLYLPQWIWLLPLILLFPIYLLTARKWLWVPVLLLCLVIGPIMDYVTISCHQDPLQGRGSDSGS